MGDLDLVWVRSYSLNGREVLTLARESAPTKWLTAADVREILGDEPPVVACDDSGPDGAIIFPTDGRRHAASGQPLDVMLAEQLRTAIRRKALSCPAESFPEPGVPDVDADDFAEPAGGEGARVAAEEAAWEAQIRAAATRAPVPAAEDRTDILWGGWRPGDRFVISPDDDEGKRWAAIHLWITACPLPGRVIDRVRLHTGIGGGDLALLVQIEGRPERVVVRVGVLCATAKKVSA